jgi:amino acid permease
LQWTGLILTASYTQTELFKHDIDEKNEPANPHHIAEDVNEGQTSNAVGGLHRRLRNRQIQRVAIGGSIGSGLFVAIGSGLYKGGPARPLIAFAIESLMVGMLNNCLAEMTTYMPVSGGFIRLADKWVDEACWGVMAGWNFFIYMALACSRLLEGIMSDIRQGSRSSCLGPCRLIRPKRLLVRLLRGPSL